MKIVVAICAIFAVAVGFLVTAISSLTFHPGGRMNTPKESIGTWKTGVVAAVIIFSLTAGGCFLIRVIASID